MTTTRPHFFLLARTVVLIAFALPVAGRARAAEPVAAESAPPSYHWYGWQSAVLDTAAVGLTLPLALRDDGAELLLFAFLGPPTYAVGAPIVHLAHDQVPKALASLGMRLGVPPVVGLGASVVCAEELRKRCFYAGAIVSMLAVMVLDDGILARETAPAPRASTPTALRLYPTFTFDRHGATAGVGLTL